jgi:hypothetical protein
VLHAEGDQDRAQQQPAEAEETDDVSRRGEDQHRPGPDHQAGGDRRLGIQEQRSFDPRPSSGEVLLHLEPGVADERPAVVERHLLHG